MQSSNFRLILSEEMGSSKEFELTQPEIIIGRDPSVDVTIPSAAISRRHAKLSRDGETYML